MEFLGGIQAENIGVANPTAQVLCPIEGLATSPFQLIRVYARFRATGVTHSVTLKAWGISASGTQTLLGELETFDCASSAIVHKCIEIPNTTYVFSGHPTFAFTATTAGLTDSVEVTANVYIEG